MRLEIPVSRERLLMAVSELAEAWGGEWSADGWGGRLRLPAMAGLRRGIVSARLRIDGDAQRSRLEVEASEGDYEVNRNAVVVLALGALGGLLVVIWPFFPQLVGLAGLGALLSFLAWFMVASRLQNSGLEEFLGDLKAELEKTTEASANSKPESVRE